MRDESGRVNVTILLSILTGLVCGLMAAFPGLTSSTWNDFSISGVNLVAKLIAILTELVAEPLGSIPLPRDSIRLIMTLELAGSASTECMEPKIEEREREFRIEDKELMGGRWEGHQSGQNMQRRCESDS